MAVEVQLPNEIALEIDRYESLVAEYLAGNLDEEVFRPIRLTNGIYGIRQGNNQQMVRVKIPQGRLDADQLEMLGRIADDFGRGFGHVTTRQNIQLHYVPLERTADAMRLIASVGLTTREACGDTVRNIVGCPLSGVCRTELFDVTPWARATTDHLLRHPISQRLPRKFKINFSGCETDCGQGMINDIGAVATRGPGGEMGFKILVGGGLGTTPFPAKVLEPFTPFEDLLITVESVLRIFDRTGNRNNHLRARMKWVVDAMGIEDFRAAVFKERDKMRSVVGPFAPHGIPGAVQEHDYEHDEPSFMDVPPSSYVEGNDYDAWLSSNVLPQRQPGRSVVFATLRLGDLTGDQFREVAGISREFASGDIRLTQRQNLAIRDVTDDELRPLYDLLAAGDMARAGAERIRDVVSCPGADTCNLAVTQSRGLAKAIGDRLEEEGLASLSGVNINISGCSNSCGQHHVADIGLMGIERRVDGNSAPGYQLFLGGGILGEEEVEFGKRSLRVGAKRAPEVIATLARRYADEHDEGERFRDWVRRAPDIEKSIADIAAVRPYSEDPDDYVDWDEIEQFQVQLGRGECAT